MEQSTAPGLGDLLGALRRRGWIVLVSFLLLTPLAVGFAYILPPVYSSTARILVESQQIPDELARSTVTSAAAERLELIRQRLMTRQNLIEIIERYNLYADFEGMPLGAKINRVREATRFEQIAFDQGRRARGPAPVSAFTITFEHNTPVQTAAIANEFVTRVLNQNLQARSERASETAAFFNQEVERLAAALASLEGEIVAFKTENDGSLPESLQFRRDELLSLENQRFQREQRRVSLEQEKHNLELQLEQLEAGAIVTPAQQMSPEERQVRDLKNALARQRAILSPTHPQIRSLEAQIAALERSIPKITSDDGTDTPADAVEFEKRRLRAQIERVEDQINLIDERLERDTAGLEELRASIARTPQIEIVLGGLLRRQSELQQQYSTAVAKQADAATGEKLEANRQAERFEVIEQAQVPAAPISPNRMLIAAGGVGASLAIGLGLIVLLELLSGAIHTPGDLQRRVQLRPVAVVPYIETRREVQMRRLRLIGAVLAVVVGVPLILLAIDQYYLPLEILAERVMSKTGLNVLIQMAERRF